MSPEALLIVFVGISAVALAAQSLSMWQTSKSITRMVENLEDQSREMEKSAQEVLQRVQGVVDQMAPLGEMAESVKTNVDLSFLDLKNKIITQILNNCELSTVKQNLL